MGPGQRLPRFRRGHVGDVPDMAHLDTVCFDRHAYPASLLERLMREGNPCLVAEDPEGGGVVGFALLMPDLQEGTGVLVTLDVSPAWRRRGVGSALVALCARCLAGMGPGNWTMWLTVATRNAGAIGFYRALGFREAGSVDDYYRDDDALVMVLDDVRCLEGLVPPAG